MYKTDHRMAGIDNTRALTYVVGDSAEPVDIQMSAATKIYQLKAAILKQRQYGRLRDLDVSSFTLLKVCGISSTSKSAAHITVRST
jgi:hypothetical protein